MRNEPPAESVVISVSEDQLEAMMERAVRRVFADAGLHLEDKEDREAARTDFQFLRLMRKATYGSAAKVGMVCITAMAGGLLLAVWVGIKAHLLK